MKPNNPAFVDRDEELAHGWLCRSDQRRETLKPTASFDADLAALRALLAQARAEENTEIVAHLHAVGDAMAKLERADAARGYHMLAIVIEGGAHRKTRHETSKLDDVIQVLKQIDPPVKS